MTDNDPKGLRRPDSLSEAATKRIRQAIVHGDFALGAPLRETSLTQFLGISKTPIREALSLLRNEGLVVNHPHRGYFVFALNRDHITQLCTYRHAMESVALDMALACEREGLVAELGEICAAMQAAREGKEFRRYLELDRDFHNAFFVRANNIYLLASYQLVAAKIATIRTHLSRTDARTDLSLSEHIGVFEALRDGRDEDARALLKQQIFRGVEAYKELVHGSPGGKG